jgi:hypothetical protein
MFLLCYSSSIYQDFNFFLIFFLLDKNIKISKI